MTDPDRVPKRPAAPQVAWNPRYRLHILVDWLVARRGSFTDSALERTAVAAGYTHEEFAAALSWAEARARTQALLSPIRGRARFGVLAVYGVVWAMFAAVYLGRPAAMYIPDGNSLQFILTIALGIGLVLSLVLIRAGRPDPERPARAMVLLFAVPVILLLGVAGLCLPFTSVS